MVPAVFVAEIRTIFPSVGSAISPGWFLELYFLTHVTGRICKAMDLRKSQCSMFLVTSEVKFFTIEVKYSIE